VPVPPADRNIDPTSIYLLPVGDTTFIKLTTGFDPLWSPDGGRISFHSWRDGDYDLYVMNRDGSGLTQLTNSGMAAYTSWSPDGSRIAWVDGGGSLKVMNSDGSNQITLARSTPGFSELRMSAWSPDGRKLAFADPMDGKIHVANADGSGQLTLEYSGAAPRAVSELPTWSPDGTRIAFVVSGDFDCLYSNCLEIDVMSAQGGEVTRLATGTEDNEYPVWSPDGRSIAFLSIPGGGCGDWYYGSCSAPVLHVMNADGTGRRQLTTGTTGSPRWSADGRTLLAVIYDSSPIGPGLVAIPASGGPARLLSSWSGVLSPDGQWVAFAGPR
jgi:Tol biopolymer transport system component